MQKVLSLSRKRDFGLLKNKGERWSTEFFVVQAMPIPDLLPKEVWHVGYIVTKKMGCAVVRNRIKRRLRVLVRSCVPQKLPCGTSVVILARQPLLRAKFAKVESAMTWALKHVARKLEEAKKHV